MLRDMDVQDVPIVSHNSEENGMAEIFNIKIINKVRAALSTAKKSGKYWTWAFADTTEKV